MLSNQIVTVAENSPKDTPVSNRIKAVDVDRDQVLSYMLVSNPGGVFKITSCNGEITVEKPVLDYETKSIYLVSVEVTDSGILGNDLLSDVCDITVRIIDVNEDPIIEPQNYEVVENAKIGSLVGLPVVAVDPDFKGSSSLLYSIVSGNEGNEFDINRMTGQLSVSKSPDFEARAKYVESEDTLETCLSVPESTNFASDISDILRLEKHNDNTQPIGKSLQCIAGSKETAKSGTTTTASTCPQGYAVIGFQDYQLNGYDASVTLESVSCNVNGCTAKCPHSDKPKRSCSVIAMCCKSEIGNLPSCSPGESITQDEENKWSSWSKCEKGKTALGFSEVTSI
jgi:hypothetical protein